MSADTSETAPTLKLILALPPQAVKANVTVGSKGGRILKARAAKQYRTGAAWEAKAALAELNARRTPWRVLSQATVEIAAFFPTVAFPDRDNLLFSLKSAFDGLTDAGVWVDDRDVIYLPPTRAKDKNRPRIELIIYPTLGRLSSGRLCPDNGEHHAQD